MQAPLPPDEVERLRALREYDILDTEPEPDFDDIALLASQICGTPIALISFIDENRQWFKSKIGLGERETPRDIAFCAHGILQPEVFVVNDARADCRFMNNPLVTGGPKIRFYAGAPLIAPDGHRLGMLCVTDQVPRELTAVQTLSLAALSRQIVARLELRRGQKALRQAVAELKRTNEELELNAAFLQAESNASLDGILVVDPEGKRISQNRRMIELFQIPPAILEDLDDEKQLQWFLGKIKNVDEFLGKVRHLYSHLTEISRDEIELKDGTILDRYSSPVVGREGKYFGRIWTFRDITERRRLEAQVFQSQKMETVGKLAGGIAHEFNSILTAIMGQSEFLLEELPAGSAHAMSAAEISKAAGRAAGLTRQLLAYGRKQLLRPETLDLNEIISSMTGMLRHLMGVTVDTQFLAAPGLRSIRADAGQIEQVIVNIAMNARDAMPSGGKLMLETAAVTFDENGADSYAELKAGDYVMLAISDTGMGMTPEIKARIFEPFFSTKAVGHGAGLGLSACYGMIKQSNGHITAYSETGRGTIFKIFWPVATPRVTAALPPLGSPGLPRGTETILLVEDDPALREMAATLLTRLGYKLLAAANGIEALRLKHQHGSGHIDLLFTDVVMPHMSGSELSDRMRALSPHTRILFASAYTEKAIVHQGVVNAGMMLLHKPFTPSAMAHKVREALDQAAPSAPERGEQSA